MEDRFFFSYRAVDVISACDGGNNFMAVGPFLPALPMGIFVRLFSSSALIDEHHSGRPRALRSEAGLRALEGGDTQSATLAGLDPNWTAESTQPL